MMVRSFWHWNYPIGEAETGCFVFHWFVSRVLSVGLFIIHVVVIVRLSYVTESLPRNLLY